MNIYAALARGDSIEMMLPGLRQDLGADALILFYVGDDHALLDFQKGSRYFLEDLKNQLLQRLFEHAKSRQQTDLLRQSVHLAFAESQLFQLEPRYSSSRVQFHFIPFDDELLGGLAIIYPETDTRPPVTEEQLQPLLVALGVARRIESARHANEATLDRLDEMVRVGQVFADGLPLDRTLVRLLEIAVDLVGTGGGVIIQNTPGEPPVPPIGWGLPPDWVDGIKLKNGHRLVEVALAKARAFYFATLEELDPATLPKFLSSLAVVPMTYEGGTLGCICIPNPPPRFFEHEIEQRTLMAMASLAGGAIQSARHLKAEVRAQRLRDEVRLAAEVQARLLPRHLPENDLLEAAAIMKPAVYLGGDFYDLFEIDTGRWGMIVADVSGKGPAAAMLMATARAYLHALAREGFSAGEVFTRMNRALLRDFTDGRFLTAVYLLLDFPAGQIQMAGAGHYPVFVKEASGKIHCIPCDGLPLGIIPIEYENVTHPLLPGSQIVLYTDGLIEAKADDGRFFGSEGMFASLTSHRDQSAQDLLRHILHDVENWQGQNPLSDDLTILAVRVK